MTGAPASRRRILIGATCFADAQEALALAGRLAGALPLDLAGLLVDELGQAGLGGQAGARLITAGGRLMAAPGAEELAHVARAEARAFRAALEALARAHGGAWSFEGRAGNFWADLAGAAAEADFLLIGQRRLRRSRGRVFVVGSGQTSGEAAALAEAVAGPGHQTVSPAGAGDAELLDLLERSSVAAVVIELGEKPPPAPEHMRRIAEAARSPVLVIGAHRLAREGAGAR